MQGSPPEQVLVDWLLAGDVAIQYQTHRTLLGSPSEVLASLRSRIASEGWGRCYLDLRDPATGMWGGGLYSPKWVSTHYTLLDLIHLGMDPTVPELSRSADLLVDRLWPEAGGRGRRRPPDVCVGAMLVAVATYARVQPRAGQ